MIKLQERRLQFLNDMVHYYGSDVKRRSVFGEKWRQTAAFKTKDGRCCPVGRFIPKDKYPQFLTGSVRNLKHKGIQVDIMDFIPEHIYTLGLNFLTAVTILHDTDECWKSKKGLSYSGQCEYNHIVRNYCCDDLVMQYEHIF